MSNDTKKTFSGKATWSIQRPGKIKDTKHSANVQATVELTNGKLSYVVKVGSNRATSSVTARRTTLPPAWQLASRVREMAEGIIRQKAPYGTSFSRISVNI